MGDGGFAKLPVVIAVALGIGFGASVFLNISQSQQAAQDKRLLQGTITDLRYQVNQDKLASAGPSPSPLATPQSTDATPTPSPSSSPAVAGAATMVISEYGVKLATADPVADLTYSMVPSGQYQVAALTTESLLAKYSSCKPSASNNALGFVVQKKPADPASSLDIPIKTIGAYKYYYVKPSGYCATDQAGENTLAAARAAIVNSTVPSLSN
jgi:hypothetical protein